MRFAAVQMEAVEIPLPPIVGNGMAGQRNLPPHT